MKLSIQTSAKDSNNKSVWNLITINTLVEAKAKVESQLAGNLAVNIPLKDIKKSQVADILVLVQQHVHAGFEVMTDKNDNMYLGISQRNSVDDILNTPIA